MKRLERQSVICEGQFNGGEIEPGVFHLQNIHYSDCSQKENSSSGNKDKSDTEDKGKEQAKDSCSDDSSCD